LSTVYFRIAARGGGGRTRARLLERLLARADVPRPAGDWRSDALRVIVPEPLEVPATAVAVLRASGIAERSASVTVATPVHLVAGLRSVGLPEDGILALEPGDAALLAQDFNGVFVGAGVRLVVARQNVLLCLFEEPLRVFLSPPDDLLGRDIGEHMPGGADGARVRALMSEVEMWLFDHPVNRRRRAASLAPVSSLWFWGGGATDASVAASLDGWAAGDDPLCAALEREDRYPGRASSFAALPDTPAGVVAPSAKADGARAEIVVPAAGPLGARSGIVVLEASPGSAAWAEVEQRWLVPAIEDLRAGRLGAVEISMGRRCARARRRGRFWRRARPWWETLAEWETTGDRETAAGGETVSDG
jgi:hypothetical protein